MFAPLRITNRTADCDVNPAPPPKPLNSLPPDSADFADGGVVREAGCSSGLLPVVAVLAPSFLLSVVEVTWAPVPTAVTVLVGAGETNDVFGVVLSDAEKIDPPVAADPKEQKRHKGITNNIHRKCFITATTFFAEPVSHPPLFFFFDVGIACGGLCTTGTWNAFSRTNLMRRLAMVERWLAAISGRRRQQQSSVLLRTGLL